jgi:hypothetical protein
LESRRQRVTDNRTSSLNKKPVVQNSTDLAALLPNIAELIEDGDITLGRLHPIGCVATAAESLLGDAGSSSRRYSGATADSPRPGHRQGHQRRHSHR